MDYLIENVSAENFEIFNEFLKDKMIYAGYIVPNIEHYGFCNDFFKAFLICDDKKAVKLVGTIHYNSMNVICFEFEENLIETFLLYFQKNIIKRISGNAEFLIALSIKDKKFKLIKGKVLLLDDKLSFSPFEKYTFSKAERYEDFYNIAKLLRTDFSFYSNYSSDDILAEQLYNRCLSKNGRSYFCKINNMLVSSVSTYAESQNLAVISGVVTKSNFKNKGIGTYLLCKLKNDLILENKKISIFYYDDSLDDFYKRLGVQCEKEYAKIEFF